MNDHLTSKIEEKLHELYSVYSQYENFKNYNGSLFAGKSGFFLFQLYYLKWMDKNDETMEAELIDFISSEIQGGVYEDSFCNGTAGFAWFLNHLKTNDFLELDDDLLQEFDAFVFEKSSLSFERGSHDYLHGGLGGMVYLTDRAKHSEPAKNYLIVLLEKLYQIAETSDHGIYWREPKSMVKEEEHDQCVINLHHSHGQAGKIAVLSKMISNGIKEAIPVCQKAIAFLLHYKHPATNEALLPSCIIDDTIQWPPHMGWCRGNISISIALLLAADALDDSDLTQTAIEIGQHTLQFNTPEKAGLNDAGICHGFSGISHMYLRLFHYTGLASFKEAADQWMNLTIEAGKHAEGIAGYKLFNNLTKEWIKNYELLAGTSGIGLTMLAYLSSDNMNWDDCFLLH